jgi:hypothetical protein
MSAEDRFDYALTALNLEIEGEDEAGDDGIGHYEYWGATGFDSRPYAIRRYAGRVSLEWLTDEPEEDIPGENEGFTGYSTDKFECELEFIPVPGTRKVYTDAETGITRFSCDYTYSGEVELPDDYFEDDREPDGGPDWDPDWERYYP